MTTYTQTSSPDVLIKMAQAAAKNSTLLAHLIEDRCQQQSITWAELAAELQISEMQLAKLALCRQPSDRHFRAEVAQAARHAKMNTQKLMQFLQPDSARNNSPRSFWQTLLWPNKSGDQSMIGKRTIAFGVVLIAIFFISAFIFSQPNGPKATLQVTNGAVTVRQTAAFSRATMVTVPVGESLTVSGSDTIEVPANAAAELYLFEGSVIELSENTVLELTELAESSSDHQIYLTLFNGRILNRVTKLLGINDAYEVRTPSSTASVRGTIFSVAVLDEHTTQIIVSEGIVEVSVDSEAAEVGAGEMVTAVTGQPLNVEPANNPPIPAAAPNQTPNEDSTGQSSEQSGTTSDEAAATRTQSGTPDAENPQTNETPTNTTESSALPTNTAGTMRPTNTPTNSQPSANTPAAPAAPTNAAGATQPPNSLATSLPPTNTPLPNVPTNTPVPNTNTPVPVAPTNFPAPVVPTSTPVPPIVPTDTPPPPPTEEQPSMVTICHNPGPNQQTLQVNANAVQAHLDHGDYLGPCN